jgi:hypothetical protein
VKKNKNRDKADEEISCVVATIENQKRLSSEKFQKVYETIWQNGPSVKYQNPGAREREPQFINQNPNLL